MKKNTLKTRKSYRSRYSGRGKTPDKHFREIASHRYRDCLVLLNNKRYDATAYLSGYVIECYLKYLTVKAQNLHLLKREDEVHDLDLLFESAGLKPLFEDKRNKKIRDIFSEIVDEWHPGLRYIPAGFDAAGSSRLFKQIEIIYEWLKENFP